MSTAVQSWVEQARYDLDTARAMLQSGRYLYVLFCCRQAVEKMLKAIIARRSGQLPPRLHQLIRLTEVAGLSVDEMRADFLRELSSYYIPTRYPEEISTMAFKVKAEKANSVLKQSEEVIQWLASML